MNKRSLIIALGVAVVAAVVIMLAQPASITPENTATTQPAVAVPPNGVPVPQPLSLEHIRERVKADLARIDAMKPEQWEEMRKRNPRLPATSADMRKRISDRLAQLEAMTPEQWNAQQQQMMARRPQPPVGGQPPVPQQSVPPAAR